MVNIKNKINALTVCVCGLIAMGAFSAKAQVHLDQYRPAETGEDGFAISRPNDRGHGLFGVRLDLDYGHNPLVFEERQGDMSTRTSNIVQDQFVGHLGLSLGLFDRLVLFAGLPVNFVQTGDQGGAARFNVAAADEMALGDVYAGARLRLFGGNKDVFSLALQGTFAFPTAILADATTNYSGELNVTIHPELLAEIRADIFRLALNVGARFRTAGDKRTSIANGALELEHEMTFGAGVYLGPELINLAAEFYGSTSFDASANTLFGDREGTPMEFLVGAQLHPGSGFHFGLAAGTGVQRGYGSPDFRGVATLAWADPIKAADAPVEATPTSTDSDGDGIEDTADACPNEAEDKDGFEDENGCPDTDNDADGIADTTDLAPNDPEDKDGFEDGDGKPDPDNDADGILDTNDRCPTQAEDADNIQDDDGCPEDDADSDSIADPQDRCPLTPGVVNERNPDCSGCPALACISNDGSIQILKRVEFANNKDVILERSTPVMNDVLQILTTNPQLRRVRIEGHTDDRGNDAKNLDLSTRRARSVAQWLINHGVEASRLVGFGCGELHPRETNATNAGRQENRRVEFHVIDPAPESGARSLAGCVETN